MAAQPFLAAHSTERTKCLLCAKIIVDKEKKQTIGTSGLSTIEEKAVLWANVLVPDGDEPYKEFTCVQERITRATTKSFEAHSSCRLMFRTHLDRKQKEYGIKENTEVVYSDKVELEEYNKQEEKRASGRVVKKVNFICFICNTNTSKDTKPYGEGGLGRCSEHRSFKKLHDQMILQNVPGDKHEGAAKRLELLLSGQSFDVFAVDVYYHRSCYLSFASPYKSKETVMNKDEIAKVNVLKNKVTEEFLKLVERKVIKDKEAYLMTDLLEDIKNMSTENGLQEPCMKYTYELKDKLQGHFGEKMSFYKAGRNLIVHPTSINPCMYVVATLKGSGLRDDDLTKAFASMIRRKLAKQSYEEWPMTAEELIARLDSSGPMTCIYNAIAWTVNPQSTKNDKGYVLSSSTSSAQKIWSVASDWESLLTHQRSVKSTALSLTVNRLTGSKEVTKLLNKCGHGVSYADVRLLNNTWAQQVTEQTTRKIPPGFVKGRAVHVTIDNSDGKQQTLTGAHTTHHTNGTLFQNRLLLEDDNMSVCEYQQKEENLTLIDAESKERDYGTYRIGKKKEPPPIPEYNDSKQHDLLDWCLKRDIAWVIVSVLGDQVVGQDGESAITPVGSWTAFMKTVTTSETSKSLIEYMEVVPLPPNDTVCKWYLDLLIDMAEDFGLQCIFAHSDEAIYCKMVVLQWLNEGKYDKVVNLLGGFHTIMVKLKIMYKKYGALGFRDWWVDAGAIAEGSSVQAVEGRHYFRAIRLHKQSFQALLTYRMKKMGDVSLFGADFRHFLELLRCNPTPQHLDRFMSNPEFEKLCTTLMSSTDGTESKMVIEYLEDVSTMLALISSVREKHIERHLQAERALLPQLFAFGHVNYARYLTYQHVTLTNLPKSNPAAWEELKKNGFGGSITGGSFSTVHGDFITEVTINREVKVRGGPMQGGFSTSLKAEDAFIKTSHLMAKLRTALKDKFKLLTTSTHKETTQGAKKEHEKTVQALVDQMTKYMDPFAQGVARHFKTGEALDDEVVKGLLHSTDTGETLLSKFVEERLKRSGEDRVSFFKPIQKPKLKTGLEVPKKAPRAVNILKEEKQAFGCLVGKATSASEAHSYPLTSVPLALSTEDKLLRQGSKSVLRNHMITEAAVVGEEAPIRAEWIIDGMAAVQSVSPKDTWGEYADSLFRFCLPPKMFNPSRLVIIMDTYGKNRIKSMTQKRRGHAGRKVIITEKGQTMPKSKDWNTFLQSGENKTELIKFLANHYRSDSFRSKLDIPLIFTESNNTWMITSKNVFLIERCNHHEADTRVVRHASLSDKPVVVVATDTDIFVLLVYAFNQVASTEKWYMQIDRERYVDIGAVCKAYGKEVCDVLPAYHSLTGCDTTSYPYKVGKVKPFKKLVAQNKSILLSSVGNFPNSLQQSENMLTFMQTVMYPGKEGEDYVDTRIRLYDQQKVKSSLSLLPDKHSSYEHLKRSNLQTYIWRQCLKQNIDYPPPEDNGWQQSDDGLVPVWFSCSQFPPSLHRRRRGKSKSGEEADDENSETEKRKQGTKPPKKRQKKEHITTSSDEGHSVSANVGSPSLSETDSDFLFSLASDTSDRDSDDSEDLD